MPRHRDCWAGSWWRTSSPGTRTAWPAAWLAGDLGAVAVALAAQRAAALPPDERYLERLHGMLEALADSEDAVAERLLAAHLARLDRALLEQG